MVRKPDSSLKISVDYERQVMATSSIHAAVSHFTILIKQVMEVMTLFCDSEHLVNMSYLVSSYETQNK